jgi:hypothetical protein
MPSAMPRRAFKVSICVALGSMACGGGEAASPSRNDASPSGSSIDAAAVDDAMGDAATADAQRSDLANMDAAPEASDASASGAGGPASGWNLVAIDTPLRTYVDYVNVPSSGVWTPEANGWPMLAQWENQTSRTGMRFQSFTPGATLRPRQIIGLLPIVAVSSHTIDITAAPYNAPTAPADATSAIQSALDAAGSAATQAAPVDVLVPAGTFNHSGVLTVPHDVRLRRWPEDSGGTLHATDADQSAIHLSGDRSGALFLVMTSPSTVRTTTPASGGLWIGPATAAGAMVHEPLVVGNEIATPAAAHVFGLAEEGGLWAFNYAHDGYADTFHHTGGSSHCQVVGNRAQTSSTRGDDLYAFVGYQADGDPVHHCSCIANWGRDGNARGLSAVGAGFISFQNNDIARTNWAGVYLAQEDSYSSYGTFDIRVVGNTIAQANLIGSHDGLLAFSDSPSASDSSATFGTLGHRIERLTIQGNGIVDTAAGVGNGYGIEIRSSADTGDVSGNTLTHNQTPQLVVKGTNFTQSNDTLVP